MGFFRIFGIFWDFLGFETKRTGFFSSYLTLGQNKPTLKDVDKCLVTQQHVCNFPLKLLICSEVVDEDKQIEDEDENSKGDIQRCDEDVQFVPICEGISVTGKGRVKYRSRLQL